MENKSESSVTIPTAVFNSAHSKADLERWLMKHDPAFTQKVATLNSDTVEQPSPSYLTMLASEEVLSEDWDTPEEDKAWADL